jgi:hypothetical protein
MERWTKRAAAPAFTSICRTPSLTGREQSGVPFLDRLSMQSGLIHGAQTRAGGSAKPISITLA